jgi:phenylpropionate dioxygenase-like ring-hydroxylating dioxygenase large terminal subunit
MDSTLTDFIIGSCHAEVERYKQKVPPPDQFPSALTIPVCRYTDSEFFDLEQEYVFGRSWLYAGFASEVPEPGSFKLCEHLGIPVVLVRGEDGDIRAFYNVCRHRGGPLVNEPCGRSRMLVCHFHSWTYDLTGQLQHLPSGHDFPRVDKAEIALVSVRCESWGNMVFINRDPDAVPLIESLGPLVEDFAERNMDTRKVFKTRMLNLACNWKVAIEAFIETYHLARVHPNTVSNYVDQRGTYIQLYAGGHSTMYSLQILSDSAAAHNPLGFEGSNEQRINRETIPGFAIFPNIATSTAEYEFPYLMFWPIDPSHTRLEIVYTGPDGHDDPEAPAAKQLEMMIDITVDEDISNLEWIQRSFASQANEFLRSSYIERRIYHLNEAIDRCIGTENIPERYRVEPALEVFEEDPYRQPSGAK